MGLGQTLDDYVRILTNGATFGGADKLVHAITGKDEAAATAAARQREGLGGDIAKVGANLVGAGKIFSAVKAIPGLVRAAPAAAEYIPAIAQRARVALANAGGPGLTRAEVAYRLGIPYVPSMAERALGAAGKAIGSAAAYPFRHPVVSALAGLGGLAEYASRNSDNTANAATPAVAPTAVAPSHTTNQYDRVSPDILNAGAQGQGMNPSFSQLASMVAQANGGKISLRELGALSDIAYKTAPRQAPEKPPTPAELATQRALALGEPYYQSKIAGARTQEEADQAYQNAIEFYKELGKARPYDPLASQGYNLPDDGQ